MRTIAVLCLAAICAQATRAEDSPGRGMSRRDPASMAGIEAEDSAISTLKWVHTRTVDVNRAFGEEEGDGVVSLRRQAEAQKRIGFDDKRKLSEPIPTGVRFQGDAGSQPFEGLMQSQMDAAGNVARITIPGNPPTVIDDPRKADGSKLKPTDLTRLGAGQMKNIDLANGKTLGTPSGPVSG